MAELVSDFTDWGDLILDCFAGSGTTGVVAKRAGRRAVLIEEQEANCAVIARRLCAVEAPLPMHIRPATQRPLFGDA